MARALHLHLAEDTSVSASYTITFEPVFPKDEKHVLYDLYVRFDESGIVKSIISYRQTEECATVMFRHKCDPLCLNSILGAHRI